MSNRIMKRICTTDDGTTVMVGSRIKACSMEGNQVRARREAGKQPKHKTMPKLATTSGMRSPTATVCSAMRTTMALSPKLGGTNGSPRHVGYMKHEPDQGEVDVLLLVSLYEAEDLRRNPTDGYGNPRR